MKTKNKNLNNNLGLVFKNVEAVKTHHHGIKVKNGETEANLDKKEGFIEQIETRELDEKQTRTKLELEHCKTDLKSQKLLSLVCDAKSDGFERSLKSCEQKYVNLVKICPNDTQTNCSIPAPQIMITRKPKIITKNITQPCDNPNILADAFKNQEQTFNDTLLRYRIITSPLFFIVILSVFLNLYFYYIQNNKKNPNLISSTPQVH